MICAHDLRLYYLEGHLYTDFRTDADYLDVLHYAKQNDMVVWESQTQKMFFGTAEKHEVLKAFIQRKTQQGGAS